MTTQTPATANSPVTLGRLGRPYGVRGWVHVYSLLTPAHLITQQTRCTLTIKHRSTPCLIESIKPHGDHFVAKINCIPTRESVAEWTNALLVADPSELSTLPEGDYYLDKLIGFSVVDTQGDTLGEISDIMATGANDVFIVSMPDGKETLIPHIPQVIQDIDHKQRRITADWTPL